MIQEIETAPCPNPPAKVDPCPFCGAEPYWLKVVVRVVAGQPVLEPQFYHPGVATDKDCILSGQGYSAEHVDRWNERRLPWRPGSDAPKDGTLIAGLWTMRWAAYKPGAPTHLGKGRWQGVGKFGGWDNCDPPERWLPHPTPEQLK